jgi:bifunctional non-homologous end joining protein LigD
MFKSFEFCLPTRATTVPDGPDWLHEVKYDGYRLRLERDGDRVRLITKGGYNWTSRYPWIVDAALKNRVKQFVIDGEAVVLGVDGVADFNALHSRRHDDEVQLYTFDILALDGDDLRNLPLSLRKTNGCSHAGRTASSSRHSRPARSGLISFAPPATWDSRASACDALPWIRRERNTLSHR